MKNRIEFLDIARGIAILIVVIGHAGFTWVNPYISWIQMPIFFFIGGLVFKNAQEKNQSNYAWILTKVRRLLVPYCVFGFLTYFTFKTIGPSLLPSKHNLLFGGIKLQGIYGVYWFITVYFCTTIVFNFVSQLPSKKLQIGTSVLCYGASMALAMSVSAPRVIFWDADVVGFALAFFAAGYLLKNEMDRISSVPSLVLSSAFFASIFLLQFFNVIDLEMDLKYKQYNNPILNFLVPLSAICIVLSISKLASTRLRYFLFFGQASMYIMYIHIPLRQATQLTLHISVTPIRFVVIGMIIPCAVYFVVHYLIDHTKTILPFFRLTEPKRARIN
jgi:fucose 4-O-acetylase-like acetyltransferase